MRRLASAHVVAGGVRKANERRALTSPHPPHDTHTHTWSSACMLMIGSGQSDAVKRSAQPRRMRIGCLPSNDALQCAWVCVCVEWGWRRGECL